MCLLNSAKFKMMNLGKYLRRIDRPTAGAGIAGGFMGLLISFLVAAVMLEISDNHFFAIYFGILFLIIGLAVAKRVTLSAAWEEGGKLSRFLLGLFALIVLLASVSSFILDHNALKLSPGARIPFFIILGMAVSFAVTFAIVDVINMLVGTVHSPNQVLLILAVSVLSGALFGLIFGALDIEDDRSARHALIRDERYCAPLGMFIGACTSIASQKLANAWNNDTVEAPYNPRNVMDDL